MTSQPSGIANRHLQAQLAELDLRREEERLAHAAVTAAQDRALDAVRLFAKTANQAEVDEMARDLYWFRQDLRASEVADALGYKTVKAMLAAAGPLATGTACARCGNELMRLSSPGPYSYKVPGFEDPVCCTCRDEVTLTHNYRPRD